MSIRSQFNNFTHIWNRNVFVCSVFILTLVSFNFSDTLSGGIFSLYIWWVIFHFFGTLITTWSRTCTVWYFIWKTPIINTFLKIWNFILIFSSAAWIKIKAILFVKKRRFYNLIIYVAERTLRNHFFFYKTHRLLGFFENWLCIYLLLSWCLLVFILHLKLLWLLDQVIL